MTFTIRVVVLAAASIALVSMSTVQAYAIPASVRNIDYRRRDLSVRIIEETSTHSVQPSSIVGSSTELNQRDSDFFNQIGLFNSYYKQINVNNNNLQDYAEQGPSSENDKSYQQKCATALSNFHTGLAGAQSILAELGRDRGLANYDPDNDLETKLKHLVNLNKDALEAATIIVYKTPVLGSILGPIVGDIKCILDLVLDTIENLTDGLLNSLCPMLKGVISNYSNSMCEGGSFELLGLCTNLGDLGLGSL